MHITVYLSAWVHTMVNSLIILLLFYDRTGVFKTQKSTDYNSDSPLFPLGYYGTGEIMRGKYLTNRHVCTFLRLFVLRFLMSGAPDTV